MDLRFFAECALMATASLAFVWFFAKRATFPSSLVQGFISALLGCGAYAILLFLHSAVFEERAYSLAAVAGLPVMFLIGGAIGVALALSRRMKEKMSRSSKRS